MKLVVDIPDSAYEMLQTSYAVHVVQGRATGKTFISSIFNAIKAGTPIVQCKDCKYYQQSAFSFDEDAVQVNGKCGWHNGFIPNKDWYCADGEVIE